MQRVREENAQLRQDLCQELGSVLSNGITSSSPQVLPDVTLSSPPVPSPSSTQPATSPSQDFQTQMLSVLNDIFSKFSSVISDTSTILQDTKQALNDSKLSDSKIDWIKFVGDHKKFPSWFLAITAQHSIALWRELYDPDTNSVVSSTNNDTLNGKLYAKVIGSLDGPALQHMISRPHLHGNGILLLRELHQMYKPKNVPEVIVAKTAEFWGTTKYHSHETVDDYYNRFQELLEDLSDADESISKKSAIQHFIFTLGPEFEPLQHNYHLGSILRNEKPRIGPLSWYFVGTSITLSIR